MCCLTNKEHDKFVVHNIKYYFVNSKILLNWPVIKRKGTIIILGIYEDFIDIFIKKQVMAV